MASQITHIPYGKKVLDQFLSDHHIDERKFFVGTLFPDIRYLGVIDRNQTHVTSPTITKLQTINDSFQAGMYTHSLIDFERERVLEKLGIYNLVEKTKLTIYALKFIEDEFTYNLIPDWNKYTSYLDNVLPEETKLVSQADAEKWHLLLRNYFLPPSWDNVTILAQQLQGFTPKILAEIKTETEKLRSNSKVIKLVQETYSNLFLQ